MTAAETTPPRGPVRFAWFGGILEGPVGDPAALGAAVERINALDMVQADVEVERGRFSLLFDQDTVPGERMDPHKSQELVEHLATIVGLSSAPEAIESTLHCSEAYEDQVIETLFAVRAGELECVSRSRAVHAGDLKRLHAVPGGESEFPLPRMSSGTLVALLVLFLLGGGLMAYQSGLIGQLMAADVDSLAQDRAHFEGLLQMESKGHWGKYQVTLQRGTEYPLTPDEVAALKERAASTAETAAIEAVTGGRTIFVQLLNEEDKVLQAKEVELARLLTEEAPLKVVLVGRPDARTLRLSLERGTKE